MNIVARVHLYPPSHCAGAEMMLHELLRVLVQRGHRVQVHLSRFSRATEPYTRNRVEIFPRGTANWQDEAAKADVLITHLDNTSTMISAAIAYNKPLVQVLHNTHPPTRMWATCRNDLLVYNSDWMCTELGEDPHGIVVRPPVWVDDYTVDATRGTAMTLVNLCQAKGGVIFSQLAAMMPGTRFLGVTGAYGEQVQPNLPNVEVRPHGTDMRQVYADTEFLLMPSSYESYGRVAVEAMCSGIPVLATDTPGLREALGPAGTFLPPGASALEWASQIRALRGYHEQRRYLSEAGVKRAHALEDLTRAELNTFVLRVEALTS